MSIVSEPQQLNPEDLDDALYIDGHPEEFMEGDRYRARATIDRAEDEAEL